MGRGRGEPDDPHYPQYKSAVAATAQHSNPFIIRAGFSDFYPI